jgi:hypothetical protein
MRPQCWVYEERESGPIENFCRSCIAVERIGLSFRIGLATPPVNNPRLRERNYNNVKDGFDFGLRPGGFDISVQCPSLSGFARFSNVGVRCRTGARLLRARLSPQPLGRLRSQWCAVWLRSARGGSAGRCGRAARRLSIRLLLLCPLQPLRPHSVMINPMREAVADE